MKEIRQVINKEEIIMGLVDEDVRVWLGVIRQRVSGLAACQRT
jgi:hypothetical protein